ncbi:cysteinyl leukotriene receptor 2-like [Cyprinodon tularosa]|uniref:cysteinyl leukotriene receptor 2-like n=1 Tax=Cyprinodon tularosa TaxID=77115 RepID=UPI0018E20786|nr:cysteinyl leukotriene receptor 2-like [Cyprinodon tularosa]
MGDFNKNNTSCYNGNATSVSKMVAMIVACIGLPLTIVAIYAVSVMVRSGHLVPVYLINLLISNFIRFCCLTVRAEVNNEDICIITNCILTVGVLVSMCFMVFIAFERYLVIAHPLWYKFRRNVKTSLLVCVAVWVFPSSYFPICYFDIDSAEHILASLQLLPFPLLLFFFGGTLKALSAARSVPNDQKQRILTTLVLVLVSYALLFMPRIIFLVKGNPYGSIYDVVTVIPVYAPSPSTEPGQMEEELSLESLHNTRILLATQVPPPSRKSEHRRVNWHVANSKEWTKLDEDVDKSLEAISKGNAEQKLHTMCSLIMNIGVQQGASNPAKLN